ncbi:hypothetical protein [uncultured Serinicoccus sp.]|uniref:hypothetical protein n=1 Tax=uncultured Serinicoccus sp. TaxID=735514 RepID=UPI002628FEA7|nr:hypothetical protein [uncultured Serinicoccus sp.]
MGEILHEGWMILAALLPSAGLLYLFYVVMKHMVEGDRRERAAQRAADREADRAVDPGDGGGPGRAVTDPGQGADPADRA